jgi:hypothetical protein
MLLKPHEPNQKPIRSFFSSLNKKVKKKKKISVLFSLELTMQSTQEIQVQLNSFLFVIGQ